ncbi:MAG: hypothetical protein COV67_03540 [Nitrospinae bacterium CG11_big_fil_rev_8_21_14_0_20_56_8]|nr:MAG: hypothetical protein COV67_03540 [Nitrospinae bacterium CG11_big_fil_rev_8_21_14_0_20_56_8]
MFIRSILIWGFLGILIPGPIFAGETVFRKNIEVEPFQNSEEVKGGVDIGARVAQSVKMALRNSGKIYLVMPTSGSGNMNMTAGEPSESMPPASPDADPSKSMSPMMGENSPEMPEKDTMGSESMLEGDKEMMKKPGDPEKSSMLPRHPAQIVVRGTVLEFQPKVPKGNGESPLDMGAFQRERARLRVELELYNPHLNRTLIRRKFEAESDLGTRAFNYRDTSDDLDEAHRSQSSMEISLSRFNDEAVDFIEGFLSGVPLEGFLIGFDAENRQAWINLGRRNGLHVQDQFVVYKVDPRYRDPMSHADLGDRFDHLGVLVVREVQEGFSRAVVGAGNHFPKGALVRSRMPGMPPSNRKLPPEDESAWWLFYGMNAQVQ